MPARSAAEQRFVMIIVDKEQIEDMHGASMRTAELIGIEKGHDRAVGHGHEDIDVELDMGAVGGMDDVLHRSQHVRALCAPRIASWPPCAHSTQ